MDSAVLATLHVTQSCNMGVLGLHSHRRASSAGDPGYARLMSFPDVNIKRKDGSLRSSFQQDSLWQHPGETGEIQVMRRV